MTTSTRPSRPVRKYPERQNERMARRPAGAGVAAGPGRLEPPGAAQAFEAAPVTPGERLRAARLRRRISLAEAEHATRIRARYLQALEDDDYAALPSAVYSRGFLRNYAIFLGVPPDEVMSGVPERRRRDRRPGVRSVATPIRISTPQSIWLLAAVGAAVFVLVALVWLGLSPPGNAPTASPFGQATAGPDTGQRGPTGGPNSLVTLPTLPPAMTSPTLSPATPTPAPSPTATGVNLELRAIDRSWVRVTVDGRVVLEETLAAGRAERWTGQQTVAVRVGNGAGVEVTVNGQHLGALGPAGQPIDRSWNR